MKKEIKDFNNEIEARQYFKEEPFDDKIKISKGWWKCKCGQENGRGFNLCQKCLEVNPKNK